MDGVMQWLGFSILAAGLTSFLIFTVILGKSHDRKKKIKQPWQKRLASWLDILVMVILVLALPFAGKFFKGVPLAEGTLIGSLPALAVIVFGFLAWMTAKKEAGGYEAEIVGGWGEAGWYRITWTESGAGRWIWLGTWFLILIGLAMLLWLTTGNRVIG